MSDETNFFSITFKDDSMVEHATTTQRQRCTFELPELKNTTTTGVLQYSHHLQGVYITWPHRNPILNTPPATITDTILDAPACQLEIFNKFVKYLQKKILMKICILNHLKLSYMPDKLVFASDNAEILYLEVSKRIKTNTIYKILTLYLQTVQLEFKIKPIMTEQYFSQFFINRTAPTTTACIPIIMQEPQQQTSQAKQQTEEVCQIVNLADEKTPVIPPPQQQQQQILTKQNIIDDIAMTALIENAPLPIDDLEKDPPTQPAKRLRFDSETSSSGTEEIYSQIDSCSEANESSAESDDEKTTPSEINLNNHFSKTLNTNSAGSELSFSSIGSSILRKFKNMHINTNQYTQPLLMYINRSDSTIKRDYIQKLFDKFVSEFPTTADANNLASASCIEQSRIELVEKLTSDNNLLQHIFLQATNGCIENIYQLFIIVLYTDILSSFK